MQRLRHRRALAAWLALVAIVVGGGLITTHSHDGVDTNGKLGSVELGSGHDLRDSVAPDSVAPDSVASVVAGHVDSATSHGIELCPACVAGQRQGVLDASLPTSRSLVMVKRGVRAANGLAISGSDALPPSPRGPPTV